MKYRIPTIIVVLPLLIILLALYQFRHSLQKLPRVRVGPLHSEMQASSGLKFFVFGDSGTGSPAQLKVAAAMEKRCNDEGPYDGILMLGDNVYQAGVASTEDPLWQERVFQPYGSTCLEKLPIYAVLGNHDYKGNPGAQVEMSLVSKRWFMPNRFYSVRFGNLLTLVAFDSEISEFCFRPQFCTYDYMLKAVRDYPATWTLVMSHHPLISSSSRGHGHSGGFREWFIKPVMCSRADGWLAGHAHHMEHRADEDCRMEFFLSGGAGADLYPVTAAKGPVKFAESVHGFMELTLTQEIMTAAFYDAEGSLRHSSDKRPFQRR